MAFDSLMKGNTTVRALLLAVALLASGAAFAISGRTMLHYVAYDAAFWPKNMAVTATNYPKIRLDSFAKSPVDTIVFAPALGFGSMAANLRNSAPITHQPAADSVWMRSSSFSWSSRESQSSLYLYLRAKYCWIRSARS